MKMKKSSNISVTALHRFIPQPASGRSSALPCLAAILVWSKFLWEIHLHSLFFRAFIAQDVCDHTSSENASLNIAAHCAKSFDSYCLIIISPYCFYLVLTLINFRFVSSFLYPCQVIRLPPQQKAMDYIEKHSHFCTAKSTAFISRQHKLI